MESTPSNNSAMLAAIFAPTTSWGQLATNKDRELQYHVALTQREQQKELELQAADAQIAQFKASQAENNFVAPDQVRVGRWLKKNESELEARLRDEYQGDVAQFMKTEGPAWMQSSLQRLRSSTEYKNAVHNREQIAMFEKARADGEVPMGRVVNVNGKPQYINADVDLDAFSKGNTPTFTFLGSYKPDDDLKELREQYAPGKSPFVRTPVSEEEKLNFLLQKYPEKIAYDKYYQQHSKSQVFYKTKPIDELLKFQQDKAMFGANMKLKSAQLQGAQLSNAIKAQKLQGLAEENDPASFASKMMGVAVAESNVQYDPNGNKKLKQSGVDLSQFQYGPGAAGFNAIPVYGAEDTIIQRLGLTKTKDGYSGRLPFREGIVEKNGFNAVDLSGAQFKVVGVENKILFNQNKPEDGFARVTIQFDDAGEAAKAGFLKEWLPMDVSTKQGTGTYNKSNQQATLVVPIGNLRQDRNFWHSIQKKMMGVKAANESISQLPAWGIGDDD